MTSEEAFGVLAEDRRLFTLIRAYLDIEGRGHEDRGGRLHGELAP